MTGLTGHQDTIIHVSIMPKNDLTGKVVLILGAGKNLATLLKQHFIVQDARLVIQYDSGTDAEQEQAMAAIAALGAEVLLFQYNLSDAHNITRLFNETVARFGPIDIAIDIGAEEKQKTI